MWAIARVKRNVKAYGLGPDVVYSRMFLLHLNKFRYICRVIFNS